ncbi:MAG TPA: DUF3667 domain-containing protein [Sphingomonas sp.]|nr:DUF3667 domain-containing protein [Sphingomonas sp.]
MTGDIGATADIATGALVARAFEPRAGETGPAAVAGNAAHDALCLNCGTRLIGAHCHACGQSGHVHRSLGAIGHEIAHGVFHFEGKIWRTLPLLILHPGTLTRRYVAGERVRFVSPLALFLFTVFLMFATIGTLGGELTETIAKPTTAQQQAAFSREIQKARVQLANAERERAATVRDGKPNGDLDTQILVLRGTISALNTAAGQEAREKDDFTFTDLKTGWPKLDHGIAKANANPGLMIYKLQTSAYKYSWGLISLSVPFIALLFLGRRKHHLYDHAIFVTYSIAFMMLLAIVLMLGAIVGLSSGWIVMAALLVPPVHLFAQLRGAYALRKRSAAWRTVALLNFAFAVLLAFVVLLLLHGLTE